MNDIFTKRKRKWIMQQVKSKNNSSTELKLIKYFKANSITGWRRNYTLYGKPDFVFPGYKIVIFVDGCFWHGHNCRNIRPQQNYEYWVKKINYNRKHDKKVNRELKSLNWQVIRIKECELKNVNIINRKLNLLKLKDPA